MKKSIIPVIYLFAIFAVSITPFILPSHKISWYMNSGCWFGFLSVLFLDKTEENAPLIWQKIALTILILSAIEFMYFMSHEPPYNLIDKCGLTYIAGILGIMGGAIVSKIFEKEK